MTEQVWATIFFGGIAAFVAIWGVSTQRQLARRKATFDHLVKAEFDRDLIKATLLFVKEAKSRGGLKKWAPVEKRATEQARSIRMVLNELEIISIGIQHGLIDAEMYAQWGRSGVIRKWQFAKEYVDAIRAESNNTALFHETEELVRIMGSNKPRRRNFTFKKFW